MSQLDNGTDIQKRHHGETAAITFIWERPFHSESRQWHVCGARNPDGL